jgi:hypothetical protein
VRVHSLEALAVEIPLRRNFGGSTYAVLKRCTVITRMRTDDGLVSEVYKMAHHEEPQIAQQLLAGVPHGTYVECFADPDRDPVWQTMWANRPAIKDGLMDVSADPGFGLVLDESIVQRYRVG